MPRKPTRQDGEEICRLGEKIFVKSIHRKVKGQDPENCVVIDVDSGDFEVDANELIASDRLLERRPQARSYFRRVGSKFMYHFGGHSRR